MMVKKEIIVRCPFCNSENVSKHGHNKLESEFIIVKILNVRINIL